MHILIAEDEVTIARALKVMLERNKYAVDVVDNGKDALDYIRAAGYDALVLDIRCRGWTAWQSCARQGRKALRRPHCFWRRKRKWKTA